MRSRISLYARAHRLGLAGALIVVMLLASATAGSVAIVVPWLSGFHPVTVNGIAGLGYAFAAIVLFRNEISRLEYAAPQRWWLVNLGWLGALWLLPWLVAMLGHGGVQFAYVATLCVAGVLLAGQFVRVDTLVLLLLGQFLLQTVLWQAVAGSPVRHALFMIDRVPSAVALAVSGAALLLSCVWVRDPLRARAFS